MALACGRSLPKVKHMLKATVERSCRRERQGRVCDRRCHFVLYPRSVWASDLESRNPSHLCTPKGCFSSRGDLEPLSHPPSGSCSGEPGVNPARSLDSNPTIPVSSLRLKMGMPGAAPTPWPRAEVLSVQDMQREVTPRRHPKRTLAEIFMKFMTNCHQPQREQSLPPRSLSSPLWGGAGFPVARRGRLSSPSCPTPCRVPRLKYWYLAAASTVTMTMVQLCSRGCQV